MALIEFRSTTFFKAFLIYSFIAAVAASLAVHVRLEIDNNKYGIRTWLEKKFNIKDNKMRENNELIRLIVSILITFIITIVIYHLMYFIFGWGSGLLANVCVNNTNKFCLLKKQIRYF